MASSSVFEWTCDALEQGTSLDRLEARGTMRLALKSAGLEPRDVNSHQMTTVLARVLPDELESRGIADGASICGQISQKLAEANISEQSSENSPERVFARLGGAEAGRSTAI